ncbi:MAG: chromosome segregation protein SMC [Candidatus Margulisbacteria bacterium]|nr:chromosome segregation protein SMC [Candidatus Margulisiibacteriota bacterium]MBU1022444.1 chromosome segregation protein SMC [Candidatus Margulisiibacteriota bacterium]MBU1728428.1 chromosome segregation protein SMC [Candidatus Margulisiibacteriota bacterium]MBU1954575.1 chromosome segregation protein SMC [Candidatus Margulisiibacteriota bacterium]
MYIKSLTLRGFKTFADKTEILLDPVGGITAIVGPNGCGKSNVVDAIRWVLGEQSSKSLRTENLEEIIFAGSAERKPLSMAEITLLMENSDGLLPIDFTEVSIKRRVFRDCESEFFINKSPCRLKDIKDLFLDTGLGGGTYSIISQGQVDAILSSKPEDRRAIFEEAAGINKYKTRKQAAERKLIAAEQNLLRVSDLRGEIGEQLVVLDDQAAKATEYMDAKNRLKAVDIGLCRKQLGRFLEKKQELLAKIEELKQASLANLDELKKGEQKKAELRGKVRELEGKERTLRMQLAGDVDEALKNQIIAANANLSDQKNALRDLEEQVRFAKFEIERNLQSKEKFLGRSAALGCEIPGVTSQIAEIKRKLEEIKDSTVSLSEKKKSFEGEEEQILESILNLVKDIYAKVADLSAKLASKFADGAADKNVSLLAVGEGVGSLLQELKLGTTSLENLLARKKGFKKVTEEGAAKESDLRVALAAHEVKLNNQSEEAERLKTEVSLLEKTNEIQNKDIDKYESEKTAIAQNISALEAEVADLNAKFASSRSAVNQELELLAQQREALESELDQLDQKVQADGEGTSVSEGLMRTEIALAKLEGENSAIENKLLEEYSLTVAEVQEFNDEVSSIAKAKEEIEHLRNRLRDLEPVNLLAIDECKRIKERMSFIDEHYADLNLARENLKSLITELDAKAQASFLETIEIVNRNFQEIFASLFEGGEAKIILGEGGDALTAGIEIIARPRGRKWLSLALLSGGEKSLTAIAILFSLLKTHPSPFCFLDEVDAALDDANVRRFSKMLREFARTIQMVVITHNKRTMEAADVIYGITMEEMGISKVISMKLAGVLA